MDGIINGNQLTIVKEYEFDKPNSHERDFLLYDIIEDCKNKYFRTIEYKLVYDIHFTTILIMKKSNSQLLIHLWNLKLNSMV